MRASDVDREAAVTLLRGHHDQGRLTLDEYTERVGTAYAAVTLGQLAQLLKDLPPPEHLEHDIEHLRASTPGTHVVQIPVAVPVPTLVPEPAAAKPRPIVGAGVSGRAVLRGLWTAVLAVSSVNVALWFLVLITHGPVYFWPVWVFGPPAALLGAAELCVYRHGPEHTRPRWRTP